MTESFIIYYAMLMAFPWKKQNLDFRLCRNDMGSGNIDVFI
jgi:hypothetical protein